MRKLTAAEFLESFNDNCDESRIYFVDGRWVAHCQAGVLSMPDGNFGCPNLTALLSLLAGMGIRRIDVEWDGLPAWTPEQLGSASIEPDLQVVRILGHGAFMPVGPSLMEELYDSEHRDLENWVTSQSPTPVNSFGWPGWAKVLRRRYSTAER